MKDENIITTTCEGILNEYDGCYLKYFFKYLKIIRIWTWMEKFIYKSRRHEDSKRKVELTTKELAQAETAVIRMAQIKCITGRHDSQVKDSKIIIDEGAQ